MLRVCLLSPPVRPQNGKHGVFQSKSASFVLREELPDGEERKLGTAQVDLSSFATPEKSSDKVELSFMDGKVRLTLTLTSHWLRQMDASAMGDDDASMSSVGSFASSVGRGHSGDDDDVHPEHGGGCGSGSDSAAAARISGAGAGAPAAAAAMAAGERERSNSRQSERERSDRAREAALERAWASVEVKTHEREDLEALRAELGEAKSALGRSYSEIKALKGRVDRLTNENRVLRREQRGGKRDEVVLQLETELASKEQERAEMEEQLSAAFSGVIADAQSRIASLTAERDRLLVSVEEATHGSKHKGGWNQPRRERTK
jgi:regulator of replication initiation timing